MTQRPFAGVMIMFWLCLCPVVVLAQNTAQEALDALDSALESPPADEAAKGGWLGLTIQGVDESTAGELGMSNNEGALVNSVLSENPADKAGVKVGDVILEINGEAVADASDMLRKIASRRPGDKIHLTLFRKGEKLKVSAVLGRRE